METTTEPQHFLLLNRSHDGTIVVNLAKPRGHVTHLYSISHDSKMSKMDVRKMKCDSGSAEHRPIAAIKLRTIPPRVDVTVRGVSFKMARKHPLSKTLTFRFLGAGEMKWEQIGKKGRGMRLVDFNGKTQAHFRPRMHVVSHVAGGGSGDDEKHGRSSPGRKAGWGPGFELYATRLADLDLDLIVTTGLAAAEHRRQLDDDWDEDADDVPNTERAAGGGGGGGGTRRG
ncbi:hypothetical protein CkaCkLH20_09986 [Colletotrichum karsti]|uniref:Uncharacterized protein n=1 Tax=Colletotrichum karsti TaxID=1095194 RepID=A0A9P6LDY0_9PEZI|nr:uncharacterized protein CkaCkLH20_09986 [Colletotrichum karsti]KAF9872489.1 hypothetical protein CkaCkLH20_09986 [Colletotrichum karsti]